MITKNDLEYGFEAILPGVAKPVEVTVQDFATFCNEWLLWLDAGAHNSSEVMTQQQGLCNTFLTWLMFKHTTIVDYDYQDHIAYFLDEDGVRCHEDDYGDSSNEIYEAQEVIYLLLGRVFSAYALHDYTPFNPSLEHYVDECERHAAHQNKKRVAWVRRFVEDCKNV